MTLILESSLDSITCAYTLPFNAGLAGIAYLSTHVEQLRFFKWMPDYCQCQIGIHEESSALRELWIFLNRALPCQASSCFFDQACLKFRPSQLILLQHAVLQLVCRWIQSIASAPVAVLPVFRLPPVKLQSHRLSPETCPDSPLWPIGRAYSCPRCCGYRTCHSPARVVQHHYSKVIGRDRQ